MRVPRCKRRLDGEGAFRCAQQLQIHVRACKIERVGYVSSAGLV